MYTRWDPSGSGSIPGGSLHDGVRAIWLGLGVFATRPVYARVTKNAVVGVVPFGFVAGAVGLPW